MPDADGVLILENDAIVLAADATVVTQVLGRVAAPSSRVEGSPAANSTRWIVDVECVPGEDVELLLLESRSGRRLYPDLMSFSITPLDADCYDARPFAIPGSGKLVIRTRILALPARIHYRVTLDVMHSATR